MPDRGSPSRLRRGVRGVAYVVLFGALVLLGGLAITAALTWVMT